MNNGRNNFAARPTVPNWRTEPEYAAYAPHSVYEPSWLQPSFPGSFSFRDDPMSHRGLAPWHSHEGRLGRPSFGGFPGHPPLPILLLENGGPAMEVMHMPGQAIPRYPPRLMTQGNMQVSEEEEGSRLTQDEQNKALTKLRKEVYNPTPKKLTRRLSLYYRDVKQKGKASDDENKEEDEGKSCAICLDDFEPKETVMLTPCNHMFHEACVVRWVKSHGQCPVCRFVIGEPTRNTSSSLNSSNVTRVEANDFLAGELVALLRGMEEAYFRVGHWPQL